MGIGHMAFLLSINRWVSVCQLRGHEYTIASVLRRVRSKLQFLLMQFSDKR